jgi:hypothetical protein
MQLLPPEGIRVQLKDLPDALPVVDERGTIRFANRNVADLSQSGRRDQHHQITDSETHPMVLPAR